MLGLEFAAVGVCVFFAARVQVKRKGTCDKDTCRPAIAGRLSPAETYLDVTKANSQLVEMKLLDKHKESIERKRAKLPKRRKPATDDLEDSSSSSETEEQEVFGSGMWGQHFSKLEYQDEDVTCVAVYEETINPRSVFPIIHPYVLCETKKWVYVMEKWRDGLAVSRFKRKENAIKSRGKWFGNGRQTVRRMPHLVLAKIDPNVNTTELLVWCMKHPTFKQYTDNCHTFAANLSKKLAMPNRNTLVEELLYDKY